jgi:hypothetical protein
MDLAQEIRRGEPASPRAFGGVFDVAATRVPVATRSVSSRVIIMVSPGSSSSNSSMQSKAEPVSASTAFAYPRAPTRAVYSMNVPKYLRGPGAACHRAASKCVFPTPNPPSR